MPAADSIYLQILSSMNIPVQYFGTDYSKIRTIDHGLRQYLASEDTYIKFIQLFQQKTSCSKIIKVQDSLTLYYYFYKMPHISANGKLYFCIGPVLRKEITEEALNEIAKSYHRSKADLPELFTCFSQFPVLENLPVFEKTLLAITSGIFGQQTALEQLPASALEIPFSTASKKTLPEVRLADTIENLYCLENQMMDAVAAGDAMAAFDAFQKQSRLSFRPRPGTLIRNEKNRLIVFNVLLRKAAERGGVHPVYIDDLSSRFAISIEAASSVSQLKTFPEKMIQDYCALIARQSIKNKHPLIQRCLLYIRQHCQEPLSLEDLARVHFVSKQYLSTLFHKETGLNLTSYIHQCRIEKASELLKTTGSPIQEISLQCGFQSTSYFCALFKKYYGLTPKEYQKRAMEQKK